jgi:chromatin segregation and condensation protein Rec8/ScpA/Scc1 (kleisin family)
MVFIVHYLAAREFATFAELFADIPKRIVAVVTFIALLELARTQRITIFQSVPFAELRVYRCEHVVGAESSDDVVDAGVEQEEVAI